ncbi:hypothetical protein ABT063_00630 [Streptomyces sp. NPDC002838]|uniref:hypothetical protein n=1 Tax=Streptomyces sp. NPDC002838 TaxID=3154436 RepID=UPI0033182620
MQVRGEGRGEGAAGDAPNAPPRQVRADQQDHPYPAPQSGHVHRTSRPSRVSPPAESGSAPTRRTFIATTTVAGGAALAGGLVAVPLPGSGEAAAAEAPHGSSVSLTVNGVRHTVTICA